jgi:23S rRNA (adenine2503-C2)-methyltransferase
MGTSAARPRSHILPRVANGLHATGAATTLANLMPPPHLDDRSPAELHAALVAEGLTATRADAAVALLLRDALVRGELCANVHQRLGRAAKTVADRVIGPPTELAVHERALAGDGALRLLLGTEDGCDVETVVIPATRGDRTTVCVSSQAGCAFACTFCETGRLGLQRSLSAGEIVAQFRVAVREWCGANPIAPAPINLVVMGMGEPLDNLPAVATALAVVQDDRAWGLGWRSCTVSTVGHVPNLPKFLATCRAHLAVSLHAPDDARRSRIVPANRRWPLTLLKCTLQDHLPPGRDVLVEYALFAGFNDALADADALAHWCDGLPVRVNLMPANPGPDATLRAPTMLAVSAFQHRLRELGVRAMVRHPHGREIGGACGQLAGRARVA